MTFGQSIKHVFGNYASFQGRASRSEFWWWYLFTTIVSVILFIPAMPWYFEWVGTVSTPDTLTVVPALSGLATLGIVLSLIWTLAILIPTLGVAVRRLHDTNRSAWWLLLWFLACCAIGPVILIIFWALPSTPGPNRYGEGAAQPAN